GGEVLADRPPGRPAARRAREIRELADLEQVVGLEQGEAVLELEPLTRLDLLANRLQGGGAVEECRAVRIRGCHSAYRLRSTTASARASSSPRRDSSARLL